MLPIDIEGFNKTYGPPSNWKRGHCATIAVYEGVDNNGHPFIVTAWKPNDKDKEAIAADLPIYQRYCTIGLVPSSLYTCDVDGNFNGGIDDNYFVPAMKRIKTTDDINIRLHEGQILAAAIELLCINENIKTADMLNILISRAIQIFTPDQN